MRRHPGVETIVRDRAEAYAEGARQGAPQARQVADRFHLLQNAGAALEEVLRQRRRYLEADVVGAPPAATLDPSLPPRPPSAKARQRAAARAARVARWEAVRQRREAGESILGIARTLRMGTRTVRSYLASPEPPRRQTPLQGRVSAPPDARAVTSPSLRPHLAYLERRWVEGCHNLSQLWREVGQRGFPGSRSLVAQALLPWRGPRPPPAPGQTRGRRRGRRRRYSVRWLCLRPPEQLDADETAALRDVLAGDAPLARGYDLTQRFRRLVAERDIAALAPWLTEAQASGLAPFAAFARGLIADGAAVEAALTTPWSNGPVEGHVCRVKLRKRQGYGRASLDLLRARVLAH